MAKRVFCVFFERSRKTTTTKSRKYQLPINNPLEHGFTHEVIKRNLSTMKNIAYWCMSDEIGEQGTLHTHVYFYSPNAILFSTVHQRFYGVHIEMANGTHRENRDYIRKEGKWENDAKHETSLPDTFEESGELPAERSKKQTDSAQILEMIQAGASNAEILLAFPTAMSKLQHIENTRQTLLFEKYRKFRRTNLQVHYLWGDTGTGKTSGILNRHGDENCYRVTDYKHPFDDYAGEPVIIFDEFRSSLPIVEMLDILDIYPLKLRCRYANKVACFETVYIVSNIPLEQQYPNIQQDEPRTYKAFLRRIHSNLQLLADKDVQCPF